MTATEPRHLASVRRVAATRRSCSGRASAPMTLSTRWLISPADDVWSVTRLTHHRQADGRGRDSPLWVRGEVVGCKVGPSGHWYFTLRDAMCQVRCCLWKRDSPRPGTARGRHRGLRARPARVLRGEGRIPAQRRSASFRARPSAGPSRSSSGSRRCSQEDGLFDPARKRPLPALAGTLAVVTSTAGAALRDMITVARRRWPSARVAGGRTPRVQGDGAVEELARALRAGEPAARRGRVIVGRGGGDREDLAAFNAEAVCRALAEVRVPTISAVGHEMDISLTDLVADLSAPTPSAAAELALPDAARGPARSSTTSPPGWPAGSGAAPGSACERVDRAGDRLRRGDGARCSSASGTGGPRSRRSSTR